MCDPKNDGFVKKLKWGEEKMKQSQFIRWKSIKFLLYNRNMYNQ